MSKLSQDPFRIAQWVVYPKKRLISNNPQDVDLSPSMMSLLLYLVENCDRVVTRDELLAEVWQGSIISDESISRAIAHLRKTLGDSAKSPHFIKTIPKQGYQFLVEPDFSTVNQHSQPKRASRVNWAVISLLLCVIMVGSYYLIARNEKASELPGQLFKRPLTDTLALNFNANFSADGRFVVNAEYDENHGALVIHDLTANTRRTLLDSKQYVYLSPSFSPDGKQMAYHQNPLDQFNSPNCELFIYSFISNKSSKIASCDMVADMPISWRNNGKQLIATRMNMAQMRAGLVNIDIQSGEVTPLLFPEHNNTLYMSAQLSPSGNLMQFTAFDMNTKDRNLATFDLTTKQINWLAKSHNRVQDAVWGKDDDIIYFADNTHIGAGIWRLEVSSGDKQFVYNQTVRGFDFDVNNGRFVVSIDQGNSDIWQATLETDDKTLVKNTPLIHTKANEQKPAISHDGKRLAFTSDKGGELNLWIRELGTGQQTQMTHVNKAIFNNVYWSEDDTMISTVKLSEGGNELQVHDSRIADKVIASLPNVTYANWHNSSQVMNVLFKDPEKTGAYHWNVASSEQNRLFDTTIFKIATISNKQFLVQKQAYGPLFTVSVEHQPNSQGQGPIWQEFVSDKIIPHWQIDQQQLSLMRVDEHKKTVLMQFDKHSGKPLAQQLLALKSAKYAHYAIDYKHQRLFYLDREVLGTNLFILESMGK